MSSDSSCSITAYGLNMLEGFHAEFCGLKKPLEAAEKQPKVLLFRVKKFLLLEDVLIRGILVKVVICWFLLFIDFVPVSDDHCCVVFALLLTEDGNQTVCLL